MIFCSSADAPASVGAVSAGAVSSATGAAGSSGAVGAGEEPEMRSVTVGAGFGGGATGAGAGGCFTGSGVLMMREIGGRKERVVRVSESARLGFGFFSSISETDSTGAFGAGLSAFSAAAAAALSAAAARERAAGVGATAVERGAAFAGVFTVGALLAVVLVDFAVDSEATADFAAFPLAVDLREEVLVVVLVGMGKIFLHGSGLSAVAKIKVQWSLREEWPREFLPPLPAPPRECPPNRKRRHRAIPPGW